MMTDLNTNDNFPRNGFYTPPSTSYPKTPLKPKTWMSEKKQSSQSYSPVNPHFFHVIHKVPLGNSPYVKAKHVQIVEKDPGKAVSMFWDAINSGDRVDSALKDMAAVMKQLNRPNEAIEAIRSFRYLCPPDSQESIDNVLVELYKRAGRLEEEIKVLLHKLKRVEEMNCFDGKPLRMGRSHGKRIPVKPQQEYARLLGNLAWAYLQLNDFKTAEEYYRKALSIEPDRNKQCNLAICLMYMNNITEAKFLLQSIQTSTPQGKMDEAYTKSYERAYELLTEIESRSSLEENKENHPANFGNFAFSPYKIPLRSPLTQPRRCLATYTPPIPSGKLLISPFTQPRTKSKRSDTDTWRNGAHKRLQFEDQSDSRPPTTVKRSKNLSVGTTRPSDTDNWRKGTQETGTVTHLPRTVQLENQTDQSTLRPPTDVKKSLNLSAVSTNCVKKSWADIVDDEEEKTYRMCCS